MGFSWARGELTSGPAKLGWGSEGGFHSGQRLSDGCPGWVLTGDPSGFVLPVLGRKGLFWGLGEHAGSQTSFPPLPQPWLGQTFGVILRLLTDVQNRKAVKLELGRKEGR